MWLTGGGKDSFAEETAGFQLISAAEYPTFNEDGRMVVPNSGDENCEGNKKISLLIKLLKVVLTVPNITVSARGYFQW